MSRKLTLKVNVGPNIKQTLEFIAAWKRHLQNAIEADRGMDPIFCLPTEAELNSIPPEYRDVLMALSIPPDENECRSGLKEQYQILMDLLLSEECGKPVLYSFLECDELESLLEDNELRSMLLATITGRRDEFTAALFTCFQAGGMTTSVFACLISSISGAAAFEYDFIENAVYDAINRNPRLFIESLFKLDSPVGLAWLFSDENKNGLLEGDKFIQLFVAYVSENLDLFCAALFTEFKNPLFSVDSITSFGILTFSSLGRVLLSNSKFVAVLGEAMKKSPKLFAKALFSKIPDILGSDDQRNSCFIQLLKTANGLAFMQVPEVESQMLTACSCESDLARESFGQMDDAMKQACPSKLLKKLSVISVPSDSFVFPLGLLNPVSFQYGGIVRVSHDERASEGSDSVSLGIFASF